MEGWTEEGSHFYFENKIIEAYKNNKIKNL